MSKFKVLIERQYIDFAEVEIEADSEDTAREMAIDLVSENQDLLQASNWVGDLEIQNVTLIN
jgi:hypothetical protein